MSTLNDLLAKSSARHSHLCPRQVLGVRMALAGAEAIGLDVPRADKRMLVIVETDGCFADGIEVTTGCTVGHRTLRVEDYGKIAATFIHVKDGRAVRLAPYPDARQRAYHYAPGQKRHYFAQLEGYQVMPAQELFMIQEVELTTPIKAIISRAGVRVNCDLCGEEIINQRETANDGMILCRSCALPGYYRLAPSPQPKPVVLPSQLKKEPLPR